MFYFIIAIVVLSIAILIIRNRKSNNSNYVSYPPATPVNLYITQKEVLHLKLAGASFQKHLNSSHRKVSIGTAVADKTNPHDRYAINVYDNDGVKVGYFPKGSSSVYHTMQAKYNGKIPVLVSVYYERKGEEWWFAGDLIVPLLYENEELEKILQLIFYSYCGYPMNSAPRRDDWDRLEDWDKMKKMAESISYDLLKYINPPNCIYSLSTKLLKAEDYNKLARLEKFNYLFSDLKPQTHKTLLNRIEKAKSKIY